MQLITDEYKNLNAKLHEDNKHYGTSGSKYVKDVMRLAAQLKSQDILDYGCGKSTLAHNLPFKINQYDPCVAKYMALPEPADIVVCTDVLEHIEPELIDNVLEHIASLTKKAAYLVANTKPAIKTLADGRNAHILLRSPKWWVDKMFEFFNPITFVDNEGNVVFIVKSKEFKDEQKEEAKENGQVDERRPTSGELETSAEPAAAPKPKPKHASDFFVGI